MHLYFTTPEGSLQAMQKRKINREKGELREEEKKIEIPLIFILSTGQGAGRLIRAGIL